jgi:hypothetical protein
MACEEFTKVRVSHKRVKIELYGNGDEPLPSIKGLSDYKLFKSLF